jgi:DNA-binding transcriptional LysR family regulator
MVIVAAPSYLAAHGNLEDVWDLRRHTAILTRRHLDHWDIDGQSVRVFWRINTGNAAVTRNAVRAGLGIARVPEFFAAEDLADGTLVRLLPHCDLPTYPVAAVYPRSTVPSRALRALLDDLPRWCG